MIITAYKSVADGKIFEDKSKYQAHLRKLARHRLAQKKLQMDRQAKDAVWAELYEREQSLDDWCQMVIDNQHLFWAEAAKGDPYDWERVGKKVGRSKNAIEVPMPIVLEIKHSLQWNDSVSNSYLCPHNGVTCWSSHEAKDGRPRGYPGWTGHIEWLVKWPKELDGLYLGSDLFSRGTFRTGRQRAHTGSGGGGMRFSEKHGCHVQTFGYDFRIFAADWPGLTRYREKRIMWNTLSQTEFA